MVSQFMAGTCNILLYFYQMSVELIGFTVFYFQDEIFASCRFSQRSDQAQVLYIAAITGDYSFRKAKFSMLPLTFVVLY
jgi:hypothetical protein